MNACCPEKSRLVWIRWNLKQIKHRLEVNTVQNGLNLQHDFNVRWCFSLEEALLWTLDLQYFGQKKNGSVSYKHAAFQNVNYCTESCELLCGLLWCFYQLFWLSLWRHPFTSEDWLVSKWCNAKCLQTCSMKSFLINVKVKSQFKEPITF